VPKLPNLPPMARLPKEPAPEMLRTFGPRPSLEALQADAAAGPAGAASLAGTSPVVASPSPSAYRQKNPYQAPPAEYKAPSLLREHRRLAILFAGVAAAFALYCLKLPHGTRDAVPTATTLTSGNALTSGTATPTGTTLTTSAAPAVAAARSSVAGATGAASSDVGTHSAAQPFARSIAAQPSPAQSPTVTPSSAAAEAAQPSSIQPIYIESIPDKDSR
jgi:hypothetical protein